MLALLAGYLAYVFTLSAGIWFAAGINQLPMQMALVFGLHAHVEYLRHRRIRSLVWAIAWTVAGLFFYEKTLLLLGVYAIVGFGWFCTGDTVHRLQHLWSHYRAGVLAYGALGVGYLAVYVQYGLDFSPGNANTQPWSPIAYDLVGTTMLPGLVGGPLRWQPLSVGAFGDPTQAVVLLSWVAFAALVVHAQRTRTKSRRAWSLLAFTGRLQRRAARVCARQRGRPRHRPRVPLPDRDGGAVRPGRGAGLPAPAWRAGAERGPRDAPSRRTRAWSRRSPSRSWRPRCSRACGTSTCGRTGTPRSSTSRTCAARWQLRTTSRCLWSTSASRRRCCGPTAIPRTPTRTSSRTSTTQTTYPRSSVDRLYMFDDQGHLSPVAIPPTRSQLGGSGCGFPLVDETTTIPLDGPVIGGGWWLRVSYLSPEPVDLHLQAGDEAHDLSLPKGLHNVFVQANGEFDQVTFDNYPADTGLCVTALTLGLPAPTPSAS